MLRIALVLILATAIAAVLASQSRRAKTDSQPGASFDYYVLALSWAPTFCADAGAAAANPKECARGQSIGFVVHGLWPEMTAGRSPEKCGKAQPVPKSVVNFVVRYMPSPGLIQHEWETHGVCTGLNPQGYFGAIMEMRSAVQIPVQFSSIDTPMRESPGQIEAQFAAANSTFPMEAFRTSCTRGELQEERICFDRNRKPQACPANAGRCADPSVTIRPPL